MKQYKIQIDNEEIIIEQDDDGKFIIPSKFKLQGRFPANLIHDGSDEVVGLFPNSKGASSQNNNSNGHIYRGQSLQESKTSLEGYRDWYNDNGSASRFFYCAKASKRERNIGCEGLEEKKYQMTHPQQVGTLEDRYNVTNHNNHPTVKPLKLMEYLCILTKTPPQEYYYLKKGVSDDIIKEVEKYL